MGLTWRSCHFNGAERNTNTEAYLPPHLCLGSWRLIIWCRVSCVDLKPFYHGENRIDFSSYTRLINSYRSKFLTIVLHQHILLHNIIVFIHLANIFILTNGIQHFSQRFIKNNRNLWRCRITLITWSKSRVFSAKKKQKVE